MTDEQLVALAEEVYWLVENGKLRAAAVRLCALQPSWQPIDTAPKDGTFVLLAGPSGYVTTPLRVEVGRWDAPDPRYDSANYKGSWRTYSNDHFTDGGDEPTGWMPLPAAGGVA